tara:strand:+ start:14 stop:421 length:408 start_codon:yes stop_codon:yes gene_type:complete
MASRDFKNVQAAERAVKILYMKATIGGSGAPTLVTADSLGIKSITRNGAGDYSILLGTPSGVTDKYPKLMYTNGVLLDPDAEDLQLQIDTDSVASSGLVKILTIARDSSGDAAAADPSSGATISMIFHVKNSSVK